MNDSRFAFEEVDSVEVTWEGEVYTEIWDVPMLRTPTFWDRIRFNLSPDWQVVETRSEEARIWEIIWRHIHSHERRCFRRGPTRSSRWRRVS